MAELKKKRALKFVAEEAVPYYLSQIEACCPGSKMSIVVDWDSVGDQLQAFDNLTESVSGFGNSGFGAVMQGLQDVCRDDLGREAVAAKLHTFRLVHKTTERPDHLTCTVNDGVVTVEADMVSQIQIDPRTVRDAIENTL